MLGAMNVKNICDICRKCLAAGITVIPVIWLYGDGESLRQGSKLLRLWGRRLSNRLHHGHRPWAV